MCRVVIKHLIEIWLIYALNCSTICNNLPSYESIDVDLKNILTKHNIVLSDGDENNEISLLIGADY